MIFNTDLTLCHIKQVVKLVQLQNAILTVIFLLCNLNLRFIVHPNRMNNLYELRESVVLYSNLILAKM